MIKIVEDKSHWLHDLEREFKDYFNHPGQRYYIKDGIIYKRQFLHSVKVGRLGWFNDYYEYFFFYIDAAWFNKLKYRIEEFCSHYQNYYPGMKFKFIIGPVVP